MSTRGLRFDHGLWNICHYWRIQTIILVGGFAGSELLWNTVRAWGTARDIGTIVSNHSYVLDRKYPSKLQLNNSSWSAIARGAALRGFEGSKVPVTICRRHYGYTIDRPFDKERDRASDSTYEAEGVKMVKHCMEWIYLKVTIGRSSIKRLSRPR